MARCWCFNEARPERRDQRRLVASGSAPQRARFNEARPERRDQRRGGSGGKLLKLTLQ